MEALEGKQVAGCFCQRQGSCFDFYHKGPKHQRPHERVGIWVWHYNAFGFWADLIRSTPHPFFYFCISPVKCIWECSTCTSWSWIWGKHQACPPFGDAVVHLKMDYIYRSKDYCKKYVFLLGKCGLNYSICFMWGRRKRCWGRRALHSRAYQSVLGTIKRPEVEVGFLLASVSLKIINTNLSANVTY